MAKVGCCGSKIDIHHSYKSPWGHHIGIRGYYTTPICSHTYPRFRAYSLVPRAPPPKNVELPSGLGDHPDQPTSGLHSLLLSPGDHAGIALSSSCAMQQAILGKGTHGHATRRRHGTQFRTHSYCLRSRRRIPRNKG